MLKKIRRYFVVVNSIVLITLLLIHFVIKEANHFFSLLFYTFRLPIIIVVAICFSFLLKRKYRVYNYILACILALVWLVKSYKINDAEIIDETDIEVVFWNASRKRDFWDVVDTVDDMPDVIVLVEYQAEALSQTKLKYPNYHFYWHSESEIGVFSKAAIAVHDVFISKDKTVVINFSTYKMNFYAVDVSVIFHVSRAHQLNFVNNCIQKNKETIVLGDFNLPFESKYFDEIKQNYKHAFAQKGSGFIETWFWNLPILSLDHIWVSKDLGVLKTEKISTWKSDHSMIRTVVRK